jgi:hypothetical protein
MVRPKIPKGVITEDCEEITGYCPSCDMPFDIYLPSSVSLQKIMCPNCTGPLDEFLGADDMIAPEEQTETEQELEHILENDSFTAMYYHARLTGSTQGFDKAVHDFDAQQEQVRNLWYVKKDKNNGGYVLIEADSKQN